MLSRGILKLLEHGKLNYISSPRGVTAPSHVVYADDLIVFFKVDMSSVKHHMKLMEDYGELSRQLVSKEKSIIFLASLLLEKQALQDVMEMTEGKLPFIYLGAPIFKGAAKGAYFKKTMGRLERWKQCWKRRDPCNMYLNLDVHLQPEHEAALALATSTYHPKLQPLL